MIENAFLLYSQMNSYLYVDIGEWTLKKYYYYHVCIHSLLARLCMLIDFLCSGVDVTTSCIT